MDPEELAFAGIARQAELIRAGEVSSRELVELYLERIERLNPELDAFTDVLSERSLADAAAADERRAAGAEEPLLGVPVAIKDNVDVEGAATRFGSLGYDESPATADGEIVRRLRAAGAVIIAKTTLSELAILPFTETEGWGETRNPWDTGRTVGGSSGGSAGAVAAGLVGAASATDGGGSIRIPAAFCGLVGLKPQRGRVPMEPHDHWNSLSAAGCVTRTVADTALYLDVVTAGGGDPGGPDPPEQSFVEAARTVPGKLRIAISEKPARAILPPVVSDEVKAGLAETEQLLRSLGHDVRRHEPSFGMTGNNFVARYLGGIREDVEAVPHPERMEKRTRGFGRLGRAYAGGMARRATRAAAADAEKINRSWAEFDVLVTPTVGETAIEIGRWEGRGAMRTLLPVSRTYCFTPIWNHTGQPAAAIPAGFTAKGMPRSVTLVGRPGCETTLLSLAAQIEAERPWADRRPPVS
ncbi:MAG: amidase [Solirubrobacterales bacterium]|nr:amidase [Solirubrobacterales bacterium]